MSFMTPPKDLRPPTATRITVGALHARWIRIAAPDNGRSWLQLSWNCNG